MTAAAVALLAGPVAARLRGTVAPPDAAPTTSVSSGVTVPGSSGPGVRVWDPAQGRVVTLPPEQAAEAIRDYWTRERQQRAEPAP